MKKIVSYEHESVAKILYTVTEDVYNISEELIISSSRKRTTVDVRRAVAVIIKEQCPKTTGSQIGVLIGRKHPDVYVQLKNHTSLIDSDKSYSSIYYNIRVEFRKRLPLTFSLKDMFTKRNMLEKELSYVDSQIKTLQLNT